MHRLFAFLLLLLLAVPASANVVYTYTGNPYTTCPPTPCANAPFGPNFNFVVVLTAPLPPNSTEWIENIGQDVYFTGVTPISVQWLNYTGETVELWTDSTGAITDWNISGAAYMDGAWFSTPARDDLQQVAMGNNFEVQNDPGVWTMTEYISPVPAPCTLILFSSGLLLAFHRRYR